MLSVGRNGWSLAGPLMGGFADLTPVPLPLNTHGVAVQLSSLPEPLGVIEV